LGTVRGKWRDRGLFSLAERKRETEELISTRQYCNTITEIDGGISGVKGAITVFTKLTNNHLASIMTSDTVYFLGVRFNNAF
jgi:hypothetical protein